MLQSGLNLFINYERFLRVSNAGGSENLVKARVVYGTGWAFSFVQLFNLFGMSMTYGHWTGDHTISLFVICALLIAVHCLRFSHNFLAYAIFYSLLCVFGVCFSALPDGTGINTALLPILIFVPMINAFVAGPKAAFLSGVISLFVVLALYMNSVESLIGNDSFYDSRNMQRALQAIYAVIFVTGISSIFSVTIYHTLNELEAAVGRARAAERVKSDFLATMSHELRTPMNGVLGLAQALGNTKLDHDQHKLIQTIELSGRSLLNILNDILDLSKIGAEKLELDERNFIPSHVLQGLIDTWQEAAIQKGLTLNVTMFGAVDETYTGDESRIRQIISNYIANAVKFTREGAVTVSLELIESEDEYEILVCVQDTGIGIAQQAQSRIFSSFEQADNSISREYGGTGLGLSICRKLAQLMNGQVWFESTENVGTSFFLKMPIERAEAGALTSQERNGPGAPVLREGLMLDDINSIPASVKALQVLVVEDNKINQMVMSKFLTSMGIAHKIVEDGEECLCVLRRELFDVILMDKHMPVMNGVEATREIREAKAPLCNIPIIACTADAMAGERAELMASGFDGFLSKPVNIKELAAELYAVSPPEDLGDKLGENHRPNCADDQGHAA